MSLWGYEALSILVYFIFLFFVCVKRNDFSLIDLGWAGGFLIVWGIALWRIDKVGSIHILVSLLLALWFVRLTAYLTLRARGRAEDFRYREMRERFGARANLKAFTNIFMLQAGLLLIASSGLVFLAQRANLQISILDLLASLMFILGLVLETVADYQVFKFKRTNPPKGSFVKTGLWKYSRHPNYFGEALLWWSIPLFAQTPWAVIAPAFLNFLLVKVSGIPMLEKKYEGNQEYAAYAQRTSAFIPCWPKQK